MLNAKQEKQIPKAEHCVGVSVHTPETAAGVILRRFSPTFPKMNFIFYFLFEFQLLFAFKCLFPLQFSTQTAIRGEYAAKEKSAAVTTAVRTPQTANNFRIFNN